jgi:hypothetical protein
MYYVDDLVSKDTPRTIGIVLYVSIAYQAGSPCDVLVNALEMS